MLKCAKNQYMRKKIMKYYQACKEFRPIHSNSGVDYRLEFNGLIKGINGVESYSIHSMSYLIAIPSVLFAFMVKF